MAVTRGQGNPSWNREETLLALDLFFSLHGQNSNDNSAAVAELSEFLRQLPYHSQAVKNPTFRNEAGVKFKVQNLRSALTGHGLSNCSKMDRVIAMEFGSDPSEVSRLSQQIRSTVKELERDDFEMADDFLEDFYEGKSTFVAHRKIERNSKLRTSLLKKLEDDELECEICFLSRPKLERNLHEALFEVHHLVPLAILNFEQKTKLSDVSLLCASCHRAIHKLMSIEKRNISIREARKALGVPDE
jgi:5-methylcytosine-specific restriction protein A